MLKKELLRRIRVNQNEPKPGDIYKHEKFFKFKAAHHLFDKFKKEMHKK